MFFEYPTQEFHPKFSITNKRGLRPLERPFKHWYETITGH